MTIWKQFIIPYDENDYDDGYPDDVAFQEPPHNGKSGIFIAQVFPLDGGLETLLVAGYVPSAYAKKIVEIIKRMNQRSHDFRGALGMWE